MNKKFPKLLAGLEVYADWQERIEHAERCAKGAFIATLVAIAIAVIVLGAYWLNGEVDLFVVHSVWFFMFAVGGWSLTRSPLNRLHRYLLVAAAAMLLFLVIWMIAPVPQSALRAEIARPRWLAPLLPIFVLWSAVVWLILQDCKRSPFCLLSLRWRPKALLYGIGVGALLYVQLYLARIFAGASLPSQTLDPLQMVGWFGTLVLVRGVAEELIFRATIFDYLHKVRAINLWIAVFVSMTLNLLLYLPRAPMTAPGEQQVLFWLGPTMLFITNALLWTWERGTNSVIASSMTFRILYLFLR